MAELTIGSLFSGIGGLELGLERAGLGPVAWQAEMDPFARGILARHWPEAHRYERVEDVGADAPHVDLICGGFPCQDISPAGRRAGLDGPKSGLWAEFERVLSELRPRFAVIENNGHMWRTWVPVVRRRLAALGFESFPFRLAASEVGALHQRDRAFVVADAHEQGLRVQPRWSIEEIAAEALESVRARAPWAPADAHGEGQPQPSSICSFTPTDSAGVGLQQEREPQPVRRRNSDGAGQARGSTRTIEPLLARDLHGLSPRVDRRADRERVLGNAVVPAVAEVIGRIVMEVARG